MEWGEPVATISVGVVTALISLHALRDHYFRERFLFSTEPILGHKQYYRLITSGFLHLDLFHLIFNTYTLYVFGKNIEFRCGPPIFLAIYFSSIVGGNLLSLYLHRHHEYRALGASGGVCGVIFAHIFLLRGDISPIAMVPLWIPDWAFAILYLLGTFQGIRRGTDNIGHDAHMGGAIIGLLVSTAIYPHIVVERPWLYMAVMGLSVVMLVFLIKNPMLLPLKAFLSRPGSAFTSRKREPSPELSREQQDRQVDAILDKLAKSGMNSLTKAEQQALIEASRRSRRDQG